MTNLTNQSIGRYHILEQLGQGGMATVYKAYDTRLEREVAIKVIRKEAFPAEQLDRILKRFEREALSLARMSHPNIVKVYDFGEFNGSPFLVMEYLPGGTLKQLLGKPMPFTKAASLLLPIARALDYSHRRDILHRDVKPSNILLSEEGDPLLSDFGVAKILEEGTGSTLTGTGIGLGTPEYMAPEQWVGKAVPASDLYSLGVVFYELVTGHKPYTADTPAAVLLKQASDPLPRPKQYIPDLPDEVERVIFKALAKKPEDRYEIMAAFAAALEGLGHVQQGSAPVPQPPEPTTRHKDPEPEQIPMKRHVLPAETETVDILKPQKKTQPNTKKMLFLRWLLPAIVGVGILLFSLLKIFPIQSSSSIPVADHGKSTVTSTSETIFPTRTSKITQSETEIPVSSETPVEASLLSAKEIFPGESKSIDWLGSIGFIGDFSQPSDLIVQCLTCDEKTEQQITFSGDYYTPSWSPDGTMITALRLNIATWEKKLVIMDSYGSWEKELEAYNPQFGYSSWSPDGKEIAYGTEDAELWVVNVFTNQTHRVLSKDQIVSNFDLREISWSPDGNSLLFLTDTNEDEYQSCGTIWIVNPDGSDLVRFDSPPGNCIISAAWSAMSGEENGQIAFSWFSTSGEDQEDFVMDEKTLSYEKLNDATIVYSSLYYPQYVYCGPGYYECSATH